MILACVLAAGAGACLLFGWFGYPLVLRVVSARAAARHPRRPESTPSAGVAVIVATREAPEVIRQRLLNLRGCEMAGAPLEIIVGVDRRSPFALSEYQEACGELGQAVPGDLPGGKAVTLNAAVRESSQPFLVFADSLQTFSPESIQRLLRHFADASVGSVTGTLRFGSTAPTSPLLKLFWSYELKLREMESQLDSVVAVTGAIYALRRELWTPLPAGLICDDLFVPMAVVRRGLRVVAAPDSLAVDERHFTHAQEFSRKVRTLTGMIQFCALCPWALSPLKNRIWGQFVCHKLLRLSTPYLLLLGAIGGAFCVRSPGWLWPALAGVIAVTAVVLLLAPKSGRLRRLGSQLAWGGYLLVAPVIATLHAVRGNWDIWSPTRERPGA